MQIYYESKTNIFSLQSYSGPLLWLKNVVRLVLFTLIFLEMSVELSWSPHWVI